VSSLYVMFVREACVGGERIQALGSIVASWSVWNAIYV